MRYQVIFFLMLFSCLSSSSSLVAQDSGVVHGEIELERSEKKANPYVVAQDNALEYFSALPEKLSALKNTKATLSDLSDPVVTHMAYAYLFCSIKRGICKEMIDAVLEIDIANSALSHEPACPNMKRFWKAWIDNDMEKRHNFQVKTGLISKTTTFKREVLPNYLRCEATIEKLLKESGDTILSTRYDASKGPVKNVVKVSKMLQSIKSKIPNLMIATE